MAAPFLAMDCLYALFHGGSHLGGHSRRLCHFLGGQASGAPLGRPGNGRLLRGGQCGRGHVRRILLLHPLYDHFQHAVVI